MIGNGWLAGCHWLIGWSICGPSDIQASRVDTLYEAVDCTFIPFRLCWIWILLATAYTMADKMANSTMGSSVIYQLRFVRCLSCCGCFIGICSRNYVSSGRRTVIFSAELQYDYLVYVLVKTYSIIDLPVIYFFATALTVVSVLASGKVVAFVFFACNIIPLVLFMFTKNEARRMATDKRVTWD